MKLFLKFLLVLIISLVSLSAYAEEREDISKIPVKDPIVKALWDSVWVLNNQHKYYQTIPLLNKLEKIAVEAGEKRVYAHTLENLGALYMYKGELDKAKNYFLRAHDAYLENKSFDSLALMMSAVGNIYQKKGDIDTSLIYQRKAEELLVHTSYRGPYLSIHTDLGVLHQIKGQYDSSYHHLKLVLDKLEPTDSVSITKTNSNLGFCFMSLYDYDKAEGYFREALKYTNKERWPLTHATMIGRVAALERNKGNFDVAEQKFKACIEALENSKNNFIRLLEFYPLYADVLIKNKKLDKATEIIDKAEALVQDDNQELKIAYYFPKWELAIIREDIDLSLQLYETIKPLLRVNQLNEKARYFDLESKHYKLIGNSKGALASLEKRTLVQDTLRNILNVKAVENLEIQYESAKKDTEILAANSRIKLQTWGLIIGSLMLLALILLLIWNARNRRQIQEQNNVISKSLSDKEILLREIHHRVKNNLQVISSLLSIQSRGIKNVKAKEAILEGKARVHSMSLIHQDLYKKDNLTGVRMDRYLGDLTRDLLNTYNVSEGKISLHNDIAPLKLDVESVIPLGLIVNELMSNALKYAFPEGRDGIIDVVLKEEYGILHLKIADNGIGLNTEQLKTKRDSFGHTLIRAFKNKLDAEIDISANNGTIVELKIGKYKKVV